MVSYKGLNTLLKNESQPLTCLSFCGVKGVIFCVSIVKYAANLITNIHQPNRQRNTILPTDDNMHLALHHSPVIYK